MHAEIRIAGSQFVEKLKRSSELLKNYSTCGIELSFRFPFGHFDTIVFDKQSAKLGVWKRC